MQIELHTESEDNVDVKGRKHVKVILGNTQKCEVECIVALQGHTGEGFLCGHEQLKKVTSPRENGEVKFYDLPQCWTYRARVHAIKDVGTAECTVMRRLEREQTTPKPREGVVPDCGGTSSNGWQVLPVGLQ